MRTVEQSNERAKNMCTSGYRYLYGGKGQMYTTALVNQLHKLYPNNVPLTEALKDADKGFRAIDCSGFVCDVLGISGMGSAQIRSTAAKRVTVCRANAQPGMVLWRNGHVAYVGDGLKVYEAASTKTDMLVSDFDSRSGAFTELLIVKGSALASRASSPKSNPYPVPTRTIQYRRIGMMKGNDVRWVQFELREAGYDISIDGNFGPASDKALRSFQASCKITVDGKCGPTTQKYLLAR